MEKMLRINIRKILTTFHSYYNYFDMTLFIMSSKIIYRYFLLKKASLYNTLQINDSQETGLYLFS